LARLSGISYQARRLFHNSFATTQVDSLNLKPLEPGKAITLGKPQEQALGLYMVASLEQLRQRIKILTLLPGMV